MKDGLHIYACSGFGVGTTPDKFDYWLDNTNTLTNTCAVNCLLADINFTAAKLKYGNLANADVLTALNLIDLYTVCLYGAEQYSGQELKRYGRIVGAMADEGLFHFISTDNVERDANLDALVSDAQTRFYDGDDPSVTNDTTQWFDEYVVARDYVGVSDEQIEDIREAIDNSAAISGTTSQDAAEALHANGGYYLYLYMSREQAKRIGNEVYAKWQKEKEVYDYVHKAYKSFYDSDEAIDKVIYGGICKQYDTTPEQVISTITRKPKGVGEIAAAVLAICQIIAAIVGIVATTLSIVLTICGACMQSKYAEPEDPDFGTPGFGGEDLSEIENYKESGKSLFGVIAAAALILFGIFKR